jgi:TATA-box binding protein (TBP) (component of TFIID and TFIIIB)
MTCFKCPGCPQKFDNNRSYANHKRSCKSKIKAAAATRLDLRVQNVVKTQQRQQEAALEQIPEIPEQEIEMEPDYCTITTDRSVICHEGL